MIILLFYSWLNIKQWQIYAFMQHLAVLCLQLNIKYPVQFSLHSQVQYIQMFHITDFYPYK